MTETLYEMVMRIMDDNEPYHPRWCKSDCDCPLKEKMYASLRHAKN